MSLQLTVIQTLADLLDQDASSIHADHLIVDLGLDSLLLTSIAAQVTAATGREWTEQELLRLFSARTVQDVIDLAECVAGEEPQMNGVS
jgi:acyl carrier protein